MKNFINKFRLRFKTKDFFIDSFFKEKNHQWIQTDRYLKSSFEELFSLIPLSLINDIFIKFDDLIFIEEGDSLSGEYAKMNNLAIVEVSLSHKKSLRSFNPSDAHALLIHKLGVLLSAYSKMDEDINNPELFADEFTQKLGFASEVEQIINNEQESIDKRVRMTYLTSRVFTKDN